MRDLPGKVLLGGAVAVLVLHPLLDVSALPLPLRAVLYEPVRSGAFRSLYPVIPWAAIAIVGFVAGRDALHRERPAAFWLKLSGICLALFLAVRLPAGYGNAYPYTDIASLAFWSFAKYPPDLPFLAWSFTAIFAGLAALRWITRDGLPTWLHPFEVFGRVPFFFYVVHFYVLGVAAGIVRTKWGIGETLGVWLLLLAFMFWPCAWYYRKKRERPNWVTRYV